MLPTLEGSRRKSLLPNLQSSKLMKYFLSIQSLNISTEPIPWNQIISTIPDVCLDLDIIDAENCIFSSMTLIAHAKAFSQKFIFIILLEWLLLARKYGNEGFLPSHAT